MLRRYSRLSREPGTKDYTQYGLSPSSPRDYYRGTTWRPTLRR